MIKKQRQYKRFQQNLKQALNNVQRYYSAISQMKKDSEIKTPLQKSKQIRRQKVQAFRTVEDERDHKDKQSLKYTTLTPKQKDFERVQMNVKNLNKDKQIKEFRMDESFCNKYNTVKKEYIDYSTLAGAEIALIKEEISLKQTNKEKQCKKSKNKQEVSHINIQQSIQDTKNETTSGNGMLSLQNGWLYKGEYTNGLFHGFGQLFHNQSLVYSGNFQFGYFHGYGKLTNHKEFTYLISSDNLVKVVKHRYKVQLEHAEEWDTYCGEFSKGKVKGFGELRFKAGEKIVCKWSGGKIKSNHFTFLDSSSQV